MAEMTPKPCPLWSAEGNPPAPVHAMSRQEYQSSRARSDGWRYPSEILGQVAFVGSVQSQLSSASPWQWHGSARIKSIIKQELQIASRSPSTPWSPWAQPRENAAGSAASGTWATGGKWVHCLLSLAPGLYCSRASTRPQIQIFSGISQDVGSQRNKRCNFCVSFLSFIHKNTWIFLTFSEETTGTTTGMEEILLWLLNFNCKKPFTKSLIEMQISSFKG